MTVGEKIQFYRKKIGLSQEELGQKMHVSRQTVSLWEMDKTLPTIDNLTILKEIFSVSIDDILSKEEVKDIEENVCAARESYTFKYDKEDLLTVMKGTLAPLKKRMAILCVCSIILLFFLVGSEAPDFLIGFFIGYLVLGVISHIKGILTYKRSFSAYEDRIMQSTYFFEVFDEYFVMSISKDGEIRRTQKYYLSDVEKIQSIGHVYVLYVLGDSVIIKKDELKKHSVFRYLENKAPTLFKEKKMSVGLKIASFLLIAASIASFFGGLAADIVLGSINHYETENMWVFFLFLPIPISCIAFGFYLRKKGYYQQNNVVIGIVMAVILCILGLFSVMFSDVYSHSDEPILEAEEALNMDIPTPSYIKTQDLTQDFQSESDEYVIYVSDIYFENTDVTEFEKALSEDERWMNEIPGSLKGISSSRCDAYLYDFCIIYNKDTKEYNKLPQESGSYAFISVLYNSEDDEMTIVQYEIDYKQ